MLTEMAEDDDSEDGETSDALHPYAAARAVLKVLYDTFLHYGNRGWSISPRKDGQDNFRSVGLGEAAARKALRLLVDKSLVEYRGTDSFVITDYGVSVSDHPSSLEHELPVPSSEPVPAAPILSNEVDLLGLDAIAAVVVNDALREIVTRDVVELVSAMRAGLAKCTIILGGSLLEAVLIDVLDRNRAVASSYMRKRRFPEDASLFDLINIAGDQRLLESPRYLLSPTSVAIAKAVTNHRDLIHPHAEARGRIRVDAATAQAIVHLLNVVVRDLAAAGERGDIDAYVEK